MVTKHLVGRGSFTRGGCAAGALAAGMALTACSGVSRVSEPLAAGGQATSMVVEGPIAMGKGGARAVTAGGEGGGAAAHSVANVGSGGVGGIGGTDVPGSDVGGTSAAYAGHGFVVHEWGTDTIVVGSDGSLQRGLHHEEEDLPAFVYDRIKEGTLLGAQFSPAVTIKMETPVTYFYSDQPLTARAQVAFPQGVLTQWYPGVTNFSPPIAAPDSVMDQVPLVYADPVLDVNFPYRIEQCRKDVSAIAGGLLDWGTFSVLPRGTDIAKDQPAAPLEKFGWSYARAVDSNPLRMQNGEAERFLFYRGLGDFDLPVSVHALGAGQVTVQNLNSEPLAQVFVLNVDGTSGAFSQHPAGVAAGSTLSAVAPDLEQGQPLDVYAEQLGVAVTAALDTSGLFHDEAVAMVNTWKRQWFRTPGTRILFLMPQSWTDRSIPLTIDPKPEDLRRVMLIRVEVITPEQERADVSAVALFGSDPVAAKAHFAALGRFAEPRLRRALALDQDATGAAYLATIRTANSSVANGE